MSSEPPTPPAELPTDVVDALNGYSAKILEGVARYADELAEHKERKKRRDENVEPTEIEDRPADLPDGVPAKATITIKEINDNRYYYWQWRDGDRIKSKYKEPVDQSR